MSGGAGTEMVHATEVVHAPAGDKVTLRRSENQVTITVNCFDEAAAIRLYTELNDEATKHCNIHLAWRDPASPIKRG